MQSLCGRSQSNRISTTADSRRLNCDQPETKLQVQQPATAQSRDMFGNTSRASTQSTINKHDTISTLGNHDSSKSVGKTRRGRFFRLFGRRRMFRFLIRPYKNRGYQCSTPLTASIIKSRSIRSSRSPSTRSGHASIFSVDQYRPTVKHLKVVDEPLFESNQPMRQFSTGPVRFSHPTVTFVISPGPLTGTTTTTSSSLQTDTPTEIHFPAQVNPLATAVKKTGDSSSVESLNRVDGFKRSSKRISGIKLPHGSQPSATAPIARPKATRQLTLPSIPYQPFSVPGVPISPIREEIPDANIVFDGLGDTPPTATSASKFVLPPIPFLQAMNGDGLDLPVEEYVKAADLRAEASSVAHADAKTYFDLQRKRDTVILSDQDLASMPLYLREAGNLPSRRKNVPPGIATRDNLQPTEAEVKINHKRLTDYHECCNIDIPVESSVYSQEIDGIPRVAPRSIARKPLPGAIVRKPVPKPMTERSVNASEKVDSSRQQPRLSKPLPPLPIHALTGSPLPRSLVISQPGYPQRRAPAPPSWI